MMIVNRQQRTVVHLTLTLNLHTNEYWHRTHKAAMIRYIRVCKRKWVRRMCSSSSCYSFISIMFICSFCTLANCSHPRASSQKCFISSQKNIPLSIACSLVRGSRQSGRIIYYFSTLHAKRDHSHGQASLFKF